MGVARFYSWLAALCKPNRNRTGETSMYNSRYSRVILDGLPNNIVSLAIDANSTFHNVAGNYFGYDEDLTDDQKRVRMSIIQNQMADDRREGRRPMEGVYQGYFDAIAARLEEIMREIRPQSSLILAVDGPAVSAKINQQRSRRMKSAALRTEGVFDSNNITPGTPFMMDLDDKLKMKMSANRERYPPNLIYSSHLVPGEGEHKIADMFRNGTISGQGPHCMYGLDADLFMISLLSPLNNIFLIREDITEVVDIDELKASLTDDLGTTTAVEDFVFMTYLIGNDFLPRSHAFADVSGTMYLLFNLYRDLRDKYAIEGQQWGIIEKIDGSLQVRIPQFLELLAELKRLEPEMTVLRYDYENSPRSKSKSQVLIASVVQTPGGKVFDFDMYRKYWYDEEFKPRGTVPRIEGLVPYEVTYQDIVKMAATYFGTMLWTLKYYTKGHAGVNEHWFYGYNYSPLMCDLYDVLSSGDDEVIDIVNQYTIDPLKDRPLDILQQLAAVIPASSWECLPEELRWLVTQKDHELAYLYPQEFFLSTDGVMREREGLAFIPRADSDAIYRSLYARRIMDILPRYTVTQSHETLVHTLMQQQQYFSSVVNAPQRSSYQGRQSSYQGSNRGGGQSSYQGSNRGGGQSSYQGSNRGGGQSSYQGRGGQSSYQGSNRGGGQSSYQGSNRGGQSSYQGGRQVIQAQASGYTNAYYVGNQSTNRTDDRRSRPTQALNVRDAVSGTNMLDQF